MLSWDLLFAVCWDKSPSVDNDASKAGLEDFKEPVWPTYGGGCRTKTKLDSHAVIPYQMQEYEHTPQNSSTKLPQGCTNTSKPGTLLAIKATEATGSKGR